MGGAVDVVAGFSAYGAAFVVNVLRIADAAIDAAVVSNHVEPAPIRQELPCRSFSCGFDVIVKGAHRRHEVLIETFCGIMMPFGSHLIDYRYGFLFERDVLRQSIWEVSVEVCLGCILVPFLSGVTQSGNTYSLTSADRDYLVDPT